MARISLDLTRLDLVSFSFIYRTAAQQCWNFLRCGQMICQLSVKQRKGGSARALNKDLGRLSVINLSRPKV